MPHGGRPAIRRSGRRWRTWNSPRSFRYRNRMPDINAPCGWAGIGAAGEPCDLYRCADVAFPSGNPQHSLGLGHVQQRPGRRPRPGPARKQGRRAVPTQFQPLSHWLVNAQVVTQTHRRTREPPLPKDDPTSVLLVLLIFLVLPWFCRSLSSRCTVVTKVTKVRRTPHGRLSGLIGVRSMTRKKEEPDDFRRAQHGYPIDSRESEQTTRISQHVFRCRKSCRETVMVGNLAQRRGAVPHLGHRSVPFAGPLPEPSGRRTSSHNWFSSIY